VKKGYTCPKLIIGPPNRIVGRRRERGMRIIDRGLDILLGRVGPPRRPGLCPLEPWRVAFPQSKILEDLSAPGGFFDLLAIVFDTLL